MNALNQLESTINRFKQVLISTSGIRKAEKDLEKEKIEEVEKEFTEKMSTLQNWPDLTDLFSNDVLKSYEAYTKYLKIFHPRTPNPRSILVGPGLRELLKDDSVALIHPKDEDLPTSSNVVAYLKYDDILTQYGHLMTDSEIQNLKKLLNKE